MNLKFHDEKIFGFAGGIYDADLECHEVAAICNHPESERLMLLFCAAPEMETALRLGVEMRDCQTRYFADRSKENLIASKQAEAKFDKAAKAIFEVTP